MVLGLILDLGAIGAVLNAGRFLVVSQKPVPSKAIIVLGGGPRNRVEKAAELFHQGDAPRIITSGGAPYSPGLTQAQAMYSQAIHLGVPASQIWLEQRSATTLQNAQDTLVLVLRHHITSVIVVSSDYHMRRVAVWFNRVYRHHGIRITYVAASDPWFHPQHWWSNARSVEITALERKITGRAFACTRGP